MKKRFDTHPAVFCFIATVAWSGIASAQITSVNIGTDYFKTGTGTKVTFPLPPGGTTTVLLKGKPLHGLKTTDTTVARTQNAVFTGKTDNPTATIAIQLTALSLTGNLTIGATPCTVTIKLDPNHLAMDTGTMALTVTSATGGTYTSTLNVYYQATFTPSTCPIPNPPGNPIFGMYTMVQQKPGTWSTVPPAGAYLTVTQPANCVPTNPPTLGHCLGTPDQNANNHSGLPPGVVDFYLTGPGIENGPTAAHVVCTALIQPGTPCR